MSSSLKPPAKRLRPWSMNQPTNRRLGNRQQLSGSMIAREWILVNEEADDFRYGIKKYDTFTRTVKLRANDTLGEKSGSAKTSPRTAAADVAEGLESLGLDASGRGDSVSPIIGPRRDDFDAPEGEKTSPTGRTGTISPSRHGGAASTGGMHGPRKASKPQKGNETVMSRVTVSKQLQMKRVAEMEKEIAPKPTARIRDLSKPILREVVRTLGVQDDSIDLGSPERRKSTDVPKKKTSTLASLYSKWGVNDVPMGASGLGSSRTTTPVSEVESFVSDGWIPPTEKRRMSDANKKPKSRYGPILKKRDAEFARVASYPGAAGPNTPADFDGEGAAGDASVSRPDSPSEKEIKKIAKDFVAWLGSLGGQDGIDEAMIASFFSRNTEYQPAPMVPIHLVDPATVPVELRRASPDAASALSALGFGRSMVDEMTERPRFDVTGSQRKPVQRPNFGAWYLPVDLWKRHAPGAPLEDPKSSKDKKHTTNMRKKARELDATVAQLYGAQLYKEFIVQKGLRMPRFLEAVKTEMGGGDVPLPISSQKESPQEDNSSSSDDESDDDE